MSEKRKPVFTFYGKRPGAESLRLEVFDGAEFSENPIVGGKKYRVRGNGRWMKTRGNRLLLFNWGEVWKLLIDTIPEP